MTLTPRSLFNIVLKIFGLFFLREIINEIPATFTLFVRYFSVSDLQTSIGMLIMSLLILSFYTALVLLLLFKSNSLIDWLKLDKGFFEDEFSFEQPQENKISLTTSEILTIALIITGGYILVDKIPDFCKQAYLFIDERKSFYGTTPPSIANIMATGAKILLALLILGERKRIVQFIENKKSIEADDTV